MSILGAEFFSMKQLLKSLSAFLMLCVLFTNTAFTQKKSTPKTLLWRISGNGLSQPSFLYGSFHLTDKQLFNFGDSVYAAIEKSKGFAIEVNPDSMMAAIMSNGNQKQQLISGILSNAEMKKHEQRIEELFEKKASLVTVKDIIEYRDAWRQNELFNGDDKMNSFMDGFLYGKARDMGKWVGGIEDVEDQLTVFEESLTAEEITDIIYNESSNDFFLETMKKIYLKQDLDELERVINSNYNEGSRDVILIKRNFKMADRMDSMARIRNNFFLVGAAHLPGESGLIDLMQKRGFKVEPVFSSKKIHAQEYPFKKTVITWPLVADEDSFYTVKMPGLPQDVPTDNATMKLYGDIVTSHYYFSASFSAPGFQLAADSILNEMAKRYTIKGEVIKSVDIEKQTLKGREIFYRQDSQYARLQVFVHPAGLVMAMVMSPLEKLLKSTDAEYFLNSLDINLQKKPAEFAFKSYPFPDHAFRVDFPLKPIIKKEPEDPEEHFYKTIYDCVDRQTGEEYAIQVNDVKPGFFIQGDVSGLQQFADQYVESMEGELLLNETTEFKGLPAIHTTSRVQINNTDGLLNAYHFYKGNRSYMLIAFTKENEEGKKKAAHFLDSFEFTGYKNGDWEYRLSPDESFMGWFPAPIEPLTVADDEEDVEPTVNATDFYQYNSYDASTPATFQLDRRVLSPYFWAKDDTSFFNNEIEKYRDYSDSIVYKKFLTVHDFPAVEFETHKKGNIVSEKTRYILHADTVYAIYAYMPSESFEDENYKKAFEDFKPTGNAHHISTIFTNKARFLLSDLVSGDTMSFQKASATLHEVTFEQKDIPLLLNALLQVYPDFDSAYNESNSTAAYLKDIILQVDTAKTFISFIKQNYSKLSPGQEILKPWLLALLMETPTAASFSLLKQIISTQPPAVDRIFYLRNNLYDSLELSATLFPDILQAANDPGLLRMVTYLAGTMVDSNLISRETLLQFEKPFIAQAKNVFADSENDINESAGLYYDLVKILGVLNTEESVLLLNHFLLVNDPGLKMQAALALIKNNIKVSTDELYKVAASHEYRSSFYQELKKINRLALFPKEFLSQVELARSDVFVYSYYEEYPVNVKFIQEKIMGKGRNKLKFYLFKVEFNQSAYLGIAGSYSTNKNKLDTDNKFTGIYWEQEFDETQVELFFQQYLKQLEN